MLETLESARINPVTPEDGGRSNLRNAVDFLNLTRWTITKISATTMTIYRRTDVSLSTLEATQPNW